MMLTAFLNNVHGEDVHIHVELARTSRGFSRNGPNSEDLRILPENAG